MAVLEPIGRARLSSPLAGHHMKPVRTDNEVAKTVG